MARQKINYYVFTPGAANSGTVKVLDNIKLESILMITNVKLKRGRVTMMM